MVKCRWSRSLVNSEHFNSIGAGHKQRLVGTFYDDTGVIELVWFKGIKFVQSKMSVGVKYLVFGKPSKFGSTINIAHPDVEVLTPKNQKGVIYSPFITPLKH